jgi:WD40 repeat protein
MRGKCRFYGVSSKGTLEYEAQVDVKNKRGQHARGKKVTGLYFAPTSASSSSSSSGGPGGSSGASGSSAGASSSKGVGGASTSATAAGAGGSSAEAAAAAAAAGGSLLITSNDSRVRLYDGYTLRAKYKGHSNKSTQIKASFSPKGDYVICGSDDGLAYIWSTKKTAVPGSPERPNASSFKNASSSSNMATTTSTGGGVSGGASGSGYLERVSPLNRPGSAQISGSTSNTQAATGPIKDPVAKEKNASFESFQVANDVITVALFGPECTHRPLDNLSPTAAFAASEEAAASGAGGGGALASSQAVRGGGSASLGGATAARGQIILAAGYSGEIKIYENIGLPQWL